MQRSAEFKKHRRSDDAENADSGNDKSQSHGEKLHVAYVRRLTSELSGAPQPATAKKQLRRPAGPVERGVRQRYVSREHHHSLATCMAGRAAAGASMLITGVLPGRAPILAPKGRHDLTCEAPQRFSGTAAIDDHVRDADTAERFEFIGDLIHSAYQGIGAR